MEYKKLTEKVQSYCKSHLTEKRYNHSVRVAEMCSEIAELSGYDKDRAYLAGIVHDICKEIPHDEMIALAESSDFPVTEGERMRISLLHGKAGAQFLKREFGIDDDEFLYAIGYHVCGRGDFGILGKILYVADKNERGRPHVLRDPDFIKNLYNNSLDDMFYYTVKGNYEYVKTKPGFIIMDESMEVVRALGIAE